MSYHHLKTILAALSIVLCFHGTAIASLLDEQDLLHQSQVAMHENRPQLALTQLARIQSPTSMPLTDQISYYQLLADTYARLGKPLNSIKERIKLDYYFTDATTMQHNHQLIWHLLEKMDPVDINTEILETQDKNLLAWLQLVKIAKQKGTSTQDLIQALRKWQYAFPQHPGKTMLPPSLFNNHLRLAPQTQQIALLLPLHGKLAGPGKAIRDGFM